MKFSKHNTGYTIRLERGEQIIQTLLEFCNKESVNSAYFNGIGAVGNAQLGFYHLERKEYSWQKFESPMEVVSLTGNISMVDNQPFLHIHTVLSDEKFQTIGGHLKEATVGATLELFLQITSTPLSRIFDDATGLKLLKLES